MTAFDRYLAVDWSASNRPTLGRDSIWIGSAAAGASAGRIGDAGQGAAREGAGRQGAGRGGAGLQGAGRQGAGRQGAGHGGSGREGAESGRGGGGGGSADGRVAAHNLPTRRAAEDWLGAELEAAVADVARVLVAVDFSFGYPAGFARMLLGDPLHAAPWAAVWQWLATAMVDNAANENNRWEVAAGVNRALGVDAPFWGRPSSGPADVPRRRTARYERVSEWRRAELALMAVGRRPHSTWKLAYAGAVGSQSLTGIPVLHRLRHRPTLRHVTSVWPFEGVTRGAVGTAPASAGGIVWVEAWPSLLDDTAEEGACRDERQVRALARWCRDLDARSGLADLLRAVPDDPEVLEEEGWILGAPAASTTI